MNISAKTEYACVAVLELALHFDEAQPLQVRKIADRHGIPSRFLVQILLQLKAAGMVTSTRGSCGGYQLSRSPETMTLGEVMRVVEGGSDEVTSNATITTPVSRALVNTWQKIADVQREILDATTFAELAEQTRQSNEAMYYI